MQSICRFSWLCSILHAICKICKIICSICKICKCYLQYAEYALPTLLMLFCQCGRPHWGGWSSPISLRLELPMATLQTNFWFQVILSGAGRGARLPVPRLYTSPFRVVTSQSESLAALASRRTSSWTATWTEPGSTASAGPTRIRASAGRRPTDSDLIELLRLGQACQCHWYCQAGRLTRQPPEDSGGRSRVRGTIRSEVTPAVSFQVQSCVHQAF